MEGIVAGAGRTGSAGHGRIVWRGRQSSAHSWRALKAMVRIAVLLKMMENHQRVLEWGYNEHRPCPVADQHMWDSVLRTAVSTEAGKEHAEKLALLLGTVHTVDPCLVICLEKTCITHIMG